MTAAQPRRSPAVALLLVPLALGLLMGWHSLTDRDVWFHARAGNDLLHEGRFLRTNTYSFTAPDHPWLNHEWLFQAAVAATGPAVPAAETDTLAGWSGLRLALVALVMLALLAGGGLVRRGVAPARLVASALAAVVGLLMLWTRLTLRPELVSYAALATLVPLVEATLAGGAVPAAGWFDPRRSAGLAFWLTVAWAQCHGFAALAPVIWLLGAVGGAFGPRRRTVVGRGLAGAALAVVALALTPNGPAGLLFPLRALGQFGHGDPGLAGMISELAPLMQTRDALGLTLVVFRVALGWSLAWGALQFGRSSSLRLLLLLLAAAAALQAQRALGVFAVAFIMLHTQDAPWRVPRRLASAVIGRILTAAGASAVVILGTVIAVSVVTDGFYLHEGVARRFGAGLNPAHAPTATLAVAGQEPRARVLANVDAAGAVLAARIGPVFIDGRTEAYPPSVWRRYAALRDGGAQAQAVLGDARPDAVLLAIGGGAFTRLAGEMLADPQWRLAAVDGAAALFLPGPGAPADLAAAARGLLQRCGDARLPSARRADYALAASRLLALGGDQAEAARALAAGAVVRPDHPQVQHNLGNALLAQDRFAEALAAFAAAVDANGRQAGSALNAGVCALRLGRTDEAEAWFRRTVAIEPGRFDAWANLAALLSRRGDRAGARKAMERAVELRPDDPVLRERLRAM